MAKSISEAKVKAQLAELLTRVAEQGERVVIKRDGKPIAALVSLPELARIESTQRADSQEQDGEPEWKGFQSLIGLWHDVDPAKIDRMVAEIYAERDRLTPRPIDLGD